MATSYEFVVETLDFYDGCGDDPDIIDTSGFEDMEEAHQFALSCEEPWRICLRRDTGNEEEGIVDRYYAYPNVDGIMQSRFETCVGADDGPNVPLRFSRLVFPVDDRLVSKCAS